MVVNKQVLYIMPSNLVVFDQFIASLFLSTGESVIMLSLSRYSSRPYIALLKVTSCSILKSFWVKFGSVDRMSVLSSSFDLSGGLNVPGWMLLYSLTWVLGTSKVYIMEGEQ